MLRALANRAPRRPRVISARAFARSALVRSLDEGSGAHVPVAETTKISFIESVMPDGGQIPMYRVLDNEGNVLDGAELPDVRAVSCPLRRPLIGRCCV
jgi:hypothetical protein